jgi:hypothetical protein
LAEGVCAHDTTLAITMMAAAATDVRMAPLMASTVTIKLWQREDAD